MVTAINSMSEHKYTRHCLLAYTTVSQEAPLESNLEYRIREIFFLEP